MFNIEFVHGDINSALNEPHNIVITEEMANKYFGDEDAAWQNIDINGLCINSHWCCKEYAA